MNTQNIITFVFTAKPHRIATQTFSQNASLVFRRDVNEICVLLGF